MNIVHVTPKPILQKTLTPELRTYIDLENNNAALFTENKRAGCAERRLPNLTSDRALLVRGAMSAARW